MNNTLLKGLDVLELLARGDRPLGLTDIATSLGLAKSNVHRLLQALTERRYVVRSEQDGRYRPTTRLWELGSTVIAKLDLKLYAEPVMERLLEASGESVHLSVLDGDDVVYVHKLESPNPVRAYTQIGGRAAAHCVATGKAMIAFQSASHLERLGAQLQPHTAETIADPLEFQREMARVRAQGYAVNQGEWNANVSGVAAPIMDTAGHVIAAVGLSGPKDRFKAARLRTFAPLVVDAARQIEASLAGRNPAHV